MSYLFSKHSFFNLFVILFIFLGIIACSNDTSKQAWLHGTWEHVYDSNDDFEEWMDFTPDGRIELKDNKGVYFKGKYSVSRDEISVPYKKKGESQTMIWQISSDKQTLINPSGASYKKIN